MSRVNNLPVIDLGKPKAVRWKAIISTHADIG
jgi:hypothetical protein